MSDLVLRGERVTLRMLTEDDLPVLLAVMHHPEVAAWWPGYDVARLRADTFGDPDATSLAIEFDGAFAGVVIFSEETDPYYRHAGIDIALDATRTGQGLGTDTLRTLCRYLFDAGGHHRITIDPAVANERAIAVYRKVGFRDVGVMRAHEKGADGTWHDNLLMDMLADDLR